MIVPDKQTEKFLNAPATRESAARLCKAGILPAVDFVRAAALFRTADFWKKAGKTFLSVFGDLCLIFGLFAWCLPRVGLLSRQSTVYGLAALFVFCEFFKGTRMRLLGSLLTGALIFSIEAAFGGGMTAHAALFLWAGLVFLRETVDAEFWLSPALLNIAFAVWNGEAGFDGKAPFVAGWIAANAVLLCFCLKTKRGKP